MHDFKFKKTNRFQMEKFRPFAEFLPDFISKCTIIFKVSTTAL